MFISRVKQAFAIAIVFLVANKTPVFAQHAGDVFVGRNGAATQLKIGETGSGGFVPESTIIVLPPVSGLFDGWSNNNPGFDHIVTDQPALDFYALQAGCAVRLQLIQSDPAFKFITPSFQVVDTPGQSASLGGNTLHSHFTWLIDSDDANFDPLRVLCGATYELTDTGGTGYAPSRTFTFSFANIDCVRGDCNNDGVNDARDIPSFIQTLLNPAAATPAARCSADVDRDGLVTTGDISAFVNLLLSQ